MENIKEIISLLDWNQSEENQKKGIEMARKVKNIEVFIQPVGKSYWDNAAKILYERADEELAPYLLNLMEWIRDLNWPGATIILDRLGVYKDAKTLNNAYKICYEKAKQENDKSWITFLNMIDNSLLKKYE